MALPIIQGILFDAEGVVIDTEAAWDAAQEQFLGRRGIPYERSKLKPLLSGRTLAEGASVMQDLYKYQGNVASHVKERRLLMRELVLNRLEFIPGFERFFSLVKDRYLVALATAMDVELFDLVDQRLNLTALFNGKVITLRDVHFKSKPNPDLFLCAANRLNAPPAWFAVIEDAPLGIKAALNAGMFAIGLTTTYEARLLADADLICSSFEEILAALQPD
jgi:HAD superfamily hydrolase (TIGR01509 family)